MAFPWTLQRYIFREMGKAFILTALALTASMSLGGGVLKMLDIGEVTPQQLIGLLGLLVPVSAALTLPIAVLFSAAAVYGRLSADNEFVACRAGGINLHILLLPTIVLSLISATVTFGFSNFLIPRLIQSLDELVLRDPAILIRQRLDKPQGLNLGGNIRLTADTMDPLPDQPDQLLLRDVVFAELRGEEWSRYGTAKALQVDLDLETTPPAASARMLRVSLFDREANRFVDIEEQTMPRTELMLMLGRRIKYLNLPSLLHYYRHPHEWPVASQEMQSLRIAMARRLMLESIEADLLDDRTMTLTDDRFHLRVQSASGTGRLPRDGGFELYKVSIEEQRDGRLRTARADRAVVEVVRGDKLEESRVAIEAFDVRITLDGQTINRSRETFGPVELPLTVTTQAKDTAIADLLAPLPSEDPRDPLVVQQLRARVARDRVVHDVTSTLHERTAFSASVLVLAILAASLGIMFRGAHTVVAFGIAFLPSMFVIILILAGKQLIENPGTHVMGVLVAWSGLVIVGGVDVIILKRCLRR